MRSLSELKEHQLLSLAVRKISGADDDEGSNSNPPPARGGGPRAPRAPARRNSSSGELFTVVLSASAGSSSSLEENGGLNSGDLLGAPAAESGGGHGVDSPAKLERRGVGGKNSSGGTVNFHSAGGGSGRRHSSLRSLLPFPSGRKKGPSRAR